jgi:hypothetical protein
MSTMHLTRRTNSPQAVRNNRTVPTWRLAMALNAGVAAVALIIKFSEAARTADPQFPSVIGRLENELCYFTIQSNLIVVAVCASLAWRPDRLRWVAGVPRLIGLVSIAAVSYDRGAAQRQSMVP